NMSIKFFKLIDLLNRRGITKEELRLKIGASSTTIAKLSSNKNVSLDVIDKICKALNCQPGDIMEYEDDEKL
ncbi:TPA: helix-turn-helix domain-containing protein, partial [Clostridioides difficile]